MKGSTKFSPQTLELLRQLVKKYSQANSAADQKAVRVKMRNLGFYVSDFGIQNITPALFEGLLKKGFIRSTENNIVVSPSAITKTVTYYSEVVTQKVKPQPSITIDLLASNLINGSFKKAGLIDTLVPKETGFYCIRLAEGSQLPKRYQELLNTRKHKIIYIGKAEGQPLYKRFLGQELRAKGHGTFFRSIGAVLGYTPGKGSLATAKNKNNYTFKPADEAKIIQWINTNLEVNWITYTGDFSIEVQLIQHYCPLLNDSHNPMRLEILREDKARCRMIAQQH